MKGRMKALFLDFAAIVSGGFIWALGVNIFSVPNRIAAGGATGVATVINNFTGFPVGVSIILINIPLFILSFIFLGRRFTVKTAAAMVLTSVIIDISAVFLPVFTEDKLLASVFGGILSGIGLGIICMRGMVTGGSDLVARLIDKKISFLSYGKTLLIIDFIVVVAAAAAYGDWRSALYAVITIALTSFLIDKLLDGMASGKLVYVVSEDISEVKRIILKDMDRGVTLIPAKGGYSGKDTNILMVSVRNYELPKLKKIIKEASPDSFMIIGNASEIVGEGFASSETDN